MQFKNSLLAIFLLTLAASLSPFARAQDTAFTYQGRLTVSGSAVTGAYDLQFAIYDSTSLPGTLIAGPITNSAVNVSNGLFSATLDFGPGIFTGAPRWLDISVRGAGNDPFTTLTPRQRLTAAPYSIYSSGAAGSSTNLNATNLTGNISSNAFLFLPNIIGPDPTAQLNATPFKHPPRGVNSWPNYGNSGATEYWATNTARQILDAGLLKYGYDLISIDAGWQGYRDTNGFIHEDPVRFPSGMSNVVAKLHSMGFKVGVWHGTGLNFTSVEFPFLTNNPAPLGFFSDHDAALCIPNLSNEAAIVNDARTFAAWGLDYVKLEGAGVTQYVRGTNGIWFVMPPTDELGEYWFKLFVSTLQSAQKTMYIMSASDGATNISWMKGVLNARRSGGFDIVGTYSFSFHQFIGNLNFVRQHPEMSGPGFYCSLDNMPDQPFPFDNSQTFALMAAMMGSEIVYSWVPNPILAGMTNLNIINLVDDPAANMATCIATNSTVTVWQKKLNDGSLALAFFNTNQSPYGAATSGSLTTLTDASQHWAPNAYVGSIVQFQASQNIITSNTTNTLTFASPGFPVTNGYVYFIRGANTISTTIPFSTLGPDTIYQCTDLISNTVFVASNSINVAVPEQFAYGLRMIPISHPVAASTGTFSTGFQLLSNTNHPGYVLTADANGNGTWQPASGLQFISSLVLATSTNVLNTPHSLGATPTRVRAVVVCINNDTASGWAVGDEIDANGPRGPSGSQLFQFGANTTNVFVYSSVIPLGHESSTTIMKKGGGSLVSPGSWLHFRIKVYAFP